MLDGVSQRQCMVGVCSITVVVPENQGKKALGALQSTFELELSRSNVNSISLTDVPMAIVAIVGEGMVS